MRSVKHAFRPGETAQLRVASAVSVIAVLRDANRRRFLATGFGALLLVSLTSIRRYAHAADLYPNTVAAVQHARTREMGIYYRYLEFSRKAKLDGYRGIAYMFSAFAASELIHAQGFEKVMAQLGVEVVSSAKPSVRVESTSDNLMQAVNGELDDIDSYYPEALNRLKPEKHGDAITMTTYAWESEKQHRAILKDIQRWSGSHFERVAKAIDEKTGQYFVCQICGSTQNEIPKDKCPICKLPAEHYRKIDFPA